MLSSHVVLNSPAQATLAINMIQWAKTKSKFILSTYLYNYIRPSMQTCKCWLTMRIGFAVVSMLIFFQMMSVGSSSNDHTLWSWRIFSICHCNNIFRFRMCVHLYVSVYCPRRHSVLARATSWYQVVPWTMITSQWRGNNTCTLIEVIPLSFGTLKQLALCGGWGSLTLDKICTIFRHFCSLLLPSSLHGSWHVYVVA